MADTNTAPAARITITITEESDADGNLLNTYHVSDNGADWDDEGDLELADAMDAAEERKDHYAGEGFAVIVVHA